MPCMQDLSRASAWAAHDTALTDTRTPPRALGCTRSTRSQAIDMLSRYAPVRPPAAASGLNSSQGHRAVADKVATGRARTTAACACETVAIGGKPTVLRLVVRGASRGRARSLTRISFHDIATQGCQEHGTACMFVYSDGRDSSFPIPALHINAFAGRETEASSQITASVTVYKVSHPRKTPGTRRRSSSIYSSDTVTPTVRRPDQPPLPEIIRPSRIAR